MAQGMRLLDPNLIDTMAQTPPEGIFKEDEINRLGREFCTEVVMQIASLNSWEISSYAQEFSLRYETNPQVLPNLVTKRPDEVFTKGEVEKHGFKFLQCVLWYCWFHLRRVEDQQAQASVLNSQRQGLATGNVKKFDYAGNRQRTKSAGNV